MTTIRRLFRDTRGASAIEFALLAGPFLLLLFGVVEFSRGLWTRQALLDVTASTARCVAIGQQQCTDAAGAFSAADTRTHLINQAAQLGVTLEEPIIIEPNTTCDGLDGFTRVAVTARFDSVFPITELVDMTSQSCFARNG
jgi:Flp pilus assembly protein TadG